MIYFHFIPILVITFILRVPAYVITLMKRDVCANPGCSGWIFKDCSFQQLYTRIDAIDASDHQTLSYTLASIFAPDIDANVVSDDQNDDLTQAWYSANSAIFRDKGQCVKEFMLNWVCDKYITDTSLKDLNTLLDILPSIFVQILPGGSVEAWIVKQGLKKAMQTDVSISNQLIYSVAKIVKMSDVVFLYNVGNC
ncbi:hypothetical protein C1645_735201 [Glomus cerebriforme]|uniref:Uncharacterized protein n=1 Tax=Glomus cerebriforme TaxID=658196 RepID=A0A397T6M6_9GLOM|nr:hypothetical protein C1645_735201 [Glomus cerebriforme]